MALSPSSFRLSAGALALIGLAQGCSGASRSLPEARRASLPPAAPLVVDAREILTSRGLDVLVFNNSYDGNFSDAKSAGVELIHHGVRTATNGDVRLSPTPEQWDPVPALKSRVVDAAHNRIEVRLAYDSPAFEYSIVAEPRGEGFAVSVVLDHPR